MRAINSSAGKLNGSPSRKSVAPAGHDEGKSLGQPVNVPPSCVWANPRCIGSTVVSGSRASQRRDGRLLLDLSIAADNRFAGATEHGLGFQSLG